MSTETFGRRLRGGEAVVGAWSMTGSSVVAEVLAAEDFDFVVLDGEHSENTIRDLADLLRAVEAAGTETVPVVRASGPDRAEIKRILDLGPAGIVVPQIESVAEAREAVQATLYPPAGVRGVAGGRASGYGTNLEGYVDAANADVATILQVETAGAVAAIEDIVAIDGLDALFVGPSDLSARLGVFGEFDAPAFEEAIGTVVDVAAAAGVPVGTLATSTGNLPERWSEWEMDFLVAGTDVGFLRDGAGRFLDGWIGLE